MSDLTTAVKALQDVIPDYEKAEAYYKGNQPEFFASIRMRRALMRTGVAFRMNVCRPVITAVLSRLEITSVTSPDDRISNLLDDVWSENQLDLIHQDIHEAALVYGECYVMVWPDEDDEGNNIPLITLNTPDTMRLFYDPENPRKKAFAVKAWKVGDGKRTRVNLYYPDRIEKYVSKATAIGKDSDFVKYYDDDADDDAVEGNAEWPIPNPYGEVPVFHFRTKRPYGRPEHADAFSPQDAINKMFITMMATVDSQGFPQRYFISEGGPGDALVDTVFQQAGAVDLNEDGTPKSDGGKHQLDASPGSVWELFGKGTIGQFPAADLKMFADSTSHVVGMLSAITSTPQHYFDAMTGTPSGESLRAAEAPLVKKVNHRIQSFSATWEDVLEFALDVMGVGATDPEIVVHWAPVLSSSDMDFWRGVQAKIVAGVPVRQALAEAGYTDEELDSFGITMDTQPYVVDAMRPPVPPGSRVPRVRDPLIPPMTEITPDTSQPTVATMPPTDGQGMYGTPNTPTQSFANSPIQP